MRSHDHIVAGGGWKSKSARWERFFAILSLLWLSVSIVASVALYQAGWPPPFSGSQLLCILLILPEPVFIALAVRFALAEWSEDSAKLPPPYDARKLY
jgi:hypothetical protein